MDDETKDDALEKAKELEKEKEPFPDKKSLDRDNRTFKGNAGHAADLIEGKDEEE